jgi:16S rRNA (uracil1498-N3)-methyltransferase
MTLSRIYTPQLLSEGTELELESNASAHLLRVLRLRIHDEFEIFNGKGLAFRALLIAEKKQHAIVRIVGQISENLESPLYIHLGQAISKGERMDYTLQKSSELGVHKITPLFSDFVNVKLEPARVENRMQHWNKVMISACEQSGRCIVPELAKPMTLADWLKHCNEEQKILLEPTVTTVLQPQQKPQSVALLIGPEGGFNQQEIDLAMQAGFQAIRLGPRILRTETAGPVAIAILQYLWGDLV